MTWMTDRSAQPADETVGESVASGRVTPVVNDHGSAASGHA